MKPKKSSLLSRLVRSILHIHKDENGQSLVFAVITMLPLIFFAGAVYRIGFLSSNRMKVQHVADSAAYSIALSQAHSLSALAWINEGMAQMHYHLMKYSVDVIVSAVDLEYAIPGPRGLDSTTGLVRQPDPNVNAQAVLTAYNEAYQKAQENIPRGKRTLVELNRLQQILIANFREDMLKAGVYGGGQGIYTNSADEMGGAAFSMTQGDEGRRGVELASIFPDYEELDPAEYLKTEQNYERFGAGVGLGGAYSGTSQPLPRWTQWFDAGLRGGAETSIDPWTGGTDDIDWSYWDRERSVYDSVTDTYAPLIPRTFARMGRLFFPDARGESSPPIFVLEEPPNTSNPSAPGNEPIENGRGYEAGDTQLRVSSTAMFFNDSTNQAITPFFARISGRNENNQRITEILEVTSISGNDLFLANGLQNNYWIWNESSAPCRESQFVPGVVEANCVALVINNVTRYFRRRHPNLQYGRFITTALDGRQFYPIPLNDRRFTRAYYQTRGPCWDTREILSSETPSGVLNGPTGYIEDDSGFVRRCPTCRGIDYDGDQLPDVRIFPWHAFHLQGSENLEEEDFMDVRVFREYPDDRIEQGLEDFYLGDSIDQTNQNGYGIEGIEPPLVLQEAFFKWGTNVATWMPNFFQSLILPSDWEPGWGFFAIASARPALYDRLRGEWITDFGQAADPISERQTWLNSSANLYFTEWQARLVHLGQSIQDIDAQELGFIKGINLILNRLIFGRRTYNQDSSVYQEIVRGNLVTNQLMQEALQNLVSPTNQDEHHLDIDDTSLDNIIHH